MIKFYIAPSEGKNSYIYEHFSEFTEKISEAEKELKAKCKKEKRAYFMHYICDGSVEKHCFVNSEGKMLFL